MYQKYILMIQSVISAFISYHEASLRKLEWFELHLGSLILNLDENEKKSSSFVKYVEFSETLQI